MLKNMTDDSFRANVYFRLIIMNKESINPKMKYKTHLLYFELQSNYF